MTSSWISCSCPLTSGTLTSLPVKALTIAGSVTQRIMWFTPVEAISLIFARHSSGLPAIESFSATSGR